MQSYYYSTPNAKSRRKISSAMNKMRELVSPSASTSYKPVSSSTTIARGSETATKSPESPPTLRPNSRTLKQYAFQRSDKTPLRVPASFPTSLNFSQQTVYLFDASDDEDDNHFTLDDILHEPTETIHHGHGQQQKTREAKVKQRSFQLPGSHITKGRKFSFNALPVPKGIPFQLPSKTVKKSQSSYFQNMNSISLGIKPTSNRPMETKVKKLNSVNESLTSEVYSKVSQERKRLISLPTKLDNAQCNDDLPGLHGKDPSSLEDITESSQPPTPALSFDYESIDMTCETSQLTEEECPQIDMILSSSPLFNEGHLSFTQAPKPAPSTPGYLLKSVHGYPYHEQLSPNSLAGGPETPTTCVNSCHTTTPPSKFLTSSNASSGLYNFTGKKTLIKRKLPLLSPHHIPSPLPTRDYVSPSRGPGPDMLATLDFLSELCHKSPLYSDDSDSLFDHLSSDDSPASDP